MNEKENAATDSLSRAFKIKCALISVAVIISLITVLAYVSIQGCPAYLFNFPMRTAECDVSNTLAMSSELTVAGLFAIIVALIFYQKQKKQSDELQRLARQQLEQSEKLVTLNTKITDLEFEQNRANALRILIRNLKELLDVYEIIKPDPSKGPYRNREDLNRKNKIIEKMEEVIDNIPLSHDPNYQVATVLDNLLAEAKKTPDPSKTSYPSIDKFRIPDTLNLDDLLDRIKTMITTLINVQNAISKKAKPNY